MELRGECRIAASRQRVWEGLNDPEILRQSIPGCEQIAKLSDTEFTAKVTAKVGPVKATFGGKVTLSNLNPPSGYTITGEGTGGAAGFAKGGADVSLIEDGAETILRYEAKGSVGGKLAQIGSRLIDGTARKMADDFFGRFAQVVAAAEPASAAETIEDTDLETAHVTSVAEIAQSTEAAPETMMAVAAMTPEALAEEVVAKDALVSQGPAKTETQRGLSPLIWVAGLVVIVAALLWIFAGRH